MGLDAVVYCDCFEAGKLNSPPPVPALVFVASDRSLDCKSKNLEELLAFDRWRKGACAHEDGILLHHFIGNVALVGLLHSELARRSEMFPFLLGSVLYSGTHAGDRLTLGDIAIVRQEIELLDGFAASDERSQSFVDHFKDQMRELVDSALSVGKSISF